MNLNISNIQHFSVGDGEGIRTTVFFKGCNLRCPWCHNPENLTASPVELCYKTTGKTETLGRIVTVDEIIPELLEDRDFFETSGGGVTLSGGEVMLQADGAAELARVLAAEGVTTLIDTAGCVPYTEFEKLRGAVHGYLYDYKTADAEKYKLIGGDLAVVKENLQRLLADGESVQVRVPLIPGFNASADDVTGICRSLADIGVTAVEVLPFHRLGSSKYEAMGMDYSYGKTEPMPKSEVESLTEIFREYFDHVTVGK